MSRKVLIFYMSKLSGHFHAACAIEKGLNEVAGDIRIEKINAGSYTNPILEKIINKAYIEVIKKKPELWGRMYDNPEVMKKTQKARDALHKFNMTKMKKLIEDRAPDVVFCTQAFPCGMMADYKRTSGEALLLIGVLTDHAPHSYWLYDEVDYYIVPSEETGRVLEEKGVPAKKIKAYGIPVDPKFRRRHDVRRIKKDLGFRGRSPVILVMGGSQGLGAVEEVVRTFSADAGNDYQLLVVTGSNKKLYRRLRRFCEKKGGENLCVLPYVGNIDELMEASDLIITKPGGMTIAEALVKKLPMLIVDPIPGHERMNTDYLVKKGTAIEVKDYKHIYREINRLLGSEGVLDRMRNNIEKLVKPDSALDIAKLAVSAEK